MKRRFSSFNSPSAIDIHLIHHRFALISFKNSPASSHWSFFILGYFGKVVRVNPNCSESSRLEVHFCTNSVDLPQSKLGSWQANPI